MSDRHEKLKGRSGNASTRDIKSKRAKTGKKVIIERCESHILSRVEQGSKPSEMAEIALLNPLYIIDLARTRPCEAAAQCQTAMSSLNNGFNQRKYELLGAAVGIAYNLQAVGGQWRIFCKEPFWIGFKRRPKDNSRSRNKALALVMRYVFVAKTKNEVNITNRYAKMLEREYSQGVKPEDIANIIQGYGGIEGMRRSRVADRKIVRSAKMKAKTLAMLDDLASDLGSNKKCDGKENSKLKKNKKYNKLRNALDEFYDACLIYFRDRINMK